MLRTLLERGRPNEHGEPTFVSVDRSGVSDSSVFTVDVRNRRGFTVGLTNEGAAIAPLVRRAVHSVHASFRGETPQLSIIGKGESGATVYLTPEGLVAKHVKGGHEDPRDAVVRTEALRLAVPEVRVPKQYGYLERRTPSGGRESWVLMEHASGTNATKLPRNAPLRGVKLMHELDRIGELADRRVVGFQAAGDLVFDNVNVDGDDVWVFDQ